MGTVLSNRKARVWLALAVSILYTLFKFMFDCGGGGLRQSKRKQEKSKEKHGDIPEGARVSSPYNARAVKRGTVSLTLCALCLCASVCVSCSLQKAAASSLSTVDAELTNVLERLSQVEKKVAAEAKQVDGPVGGVELRDYQLQVLARLRQIRDTMNQEGSSVEQLRKERDEARVEAEALKKQVAKLNYRVHHLKQHVSVESAN